MKSLDEQIKFINDILLPIFGIKSITDYDNEIIVGKLDIMVAYKVNKLLEDFRIIFPIKKFNLHKIDNQISTINHAFLLLKKALDLTNIPYNLSNKSTKKSLRLINENINLTKFINKTSKMSEIRTNIEKFKNITNKQLDDNHHQLVEQDEDDNVFKRGGEMSLIRKHKLEITDISKDENIKKQINKTIYVEVSDKIMLSNYLIVGNIANLKIKLVTIDEQIMKQKDLDQLIANFLLIRVELTGTWSSEINYDPLGVKDILNGCILIASPYSERCINFVNFSLLESIKEKILLIINYDEIVFYTNIIDNISNKRVIQRFNKNYTIESLGGTIRFLSNIEDPPVTSVTPPQKSLVVVGDEIKIGKYNGHMSLGDDPMQCLMALVEKNCDFIGSIIDSSNTNGRAYSKINKRYTKEADQTYTICYYIDIIRLGDTISDVYIETTNHDFGNVTCKIISDYHDTMKEYPVNWIKCSKNKYELIFEPTEHINIAGNSFGLAICFMIHGIKSLTDAIHQKINIVYNNYWFQSNVRNILTSRYDKQPLINLDNLEEPTLLDKITHKKIILNLEQNNQSDYKILIKMIKKLLNDKMKNIYVYTSKNNTNLIDCLTKGNITNYVLNEKNIIEKLKDDYCDNLIIFDNICKDDMIMTYGYQRTILNNEDFRTLFMNGRHYKSTLILNFTDCENSILLKMEPSMRVQIDQVIFNKSIYDNLDEMVRKKIYEMYSYDNSTDKFISKLTDNQVFLFNNLPVLKGSPCPQTTIVNID